MSYLLAFVSAFWAAISLDLSEIWWALSRSDSIGQVLSVAGLQILAAALGVAIFIKAPLWVEVVAALLLGAFFSQTLFSYMF